jgi:CubicO group peptidase (beta-lactamase class C family)
MTFRACIASIVAFGALAAPVAGQEPRWDGFTRALDALAAQDSVVGAAAILVRDGRVVAHRERGFADRERGQRVDERTLFHYGSITKTLTAVAIMQLRDRGLLSLDDTVTRWIPELRQVHDPFGSIDAITIRMLLSHSAGFQNPTWPYTEGQPWEPFEPTRWDQLVAMMPYQEIHFVPGSRYSYSNPAFIYLARILEQITGDPYQSYIYKNIWTPLGMTRSYFGTTPYHLAADRSNSYVLVRDSTGVERLVAQGREFDPGVTIPNGGWNAPLADLATWAAFLTDATHGDTALRRRYDTILRRSSLEEMWRPVVEVGGTSPESMGLSFFVRTTRGVRVVGHTGQQAGFRSLIYFNPLTREAVIAVVNTLNDAHGEASAAAWTRLGDAAVDVLVP